MQDVLEKIKSCNISYHELGISERSAMPIGNGELCASVWTDQTGKLSFYLSRSDAITELDRTVKMGKITLEFAPNPFVEADYVQTLDLADGCITVKGTNAVCSLWVDTEQNHIIIHGEIQTAAKVAVSYTTWRTKKAYPLEQEQRVSGCGEAPDVVNIVEDGILFYHKNGQNIIAATANNQDIDNIDLLPDYLTERIFGGWIKLDGGTGENNRLVKDNTRDFTIQVLTESMQGSTEEFTAKLLQTKSERWEESKSRSKKFWNAYWCNSYIFVKENRQVQTEIQDAIQKEAKEVMEYTVDCTSEVTKAYVWTRFMLKCCAGGAFPILYNGMLFNLSPGKNQHFNCKSFGEIYTALPEEITEDVTPDERSWCREHLWQNVRHPYYTFLCQGDTEAMKVLFRYYRRFWELNRYRAEKYYHAKGQHNTEMTLSFGLQSIDIYGEERKGKKVGYADNRYGGAVEISPALELISLMLDYYNYTLDHTFFHTDIQTYAMDIMQYVETRFTERKEGKIVIGPLNSIETYRDTINPITVVAGLRIVLDRLLKVEILEDKFKKFFSEIQTQIPEIPLRKEDGKWYLQPAEEYKEHRFNVEIPELYACFPFELCNEENNGELMKRTFEKRVVQYECDRYFKIGDTTGSPSYSGWQYQGIVAARLGMTDKAAEILLHNVTIKNPGTRFPAMWGPIYDAVPDTDHGANIVHLLQEMVMQVKGDKVYLLSAFPKDWDVAFRLHPDKETVISVTYENGVLKRMDVCPEKERDRIILSKKNQG